jgi:hypothetical protein
MPGDLLPSAAMTGAGDFSPNTFKALLNCLFHNDFDLEDSSKHPLSD